MLTTKTIDDRRLPALTLILLAGLLLAACSSPESPPTVEAPTAASATLPATAEEAAGATPTTEAAPATEPALPTAAPTETAAARESAQDPEPIEVTYFTPAQQEGPYYPVEKPADRDNDLVDLAGATAAPEGEVLSLAGVVYDAAGLPVEGALIEIWQTDSSGVYLHPNDPGTAGRDPNFQFYGESLTGADGVYSFRTILPGRYEPRPRHIHVKVKLDGQEVLTTQFYFADEVAFTGDEANLVVDLAPAEDDAGKPIWVGQRDMVLRTDR